MDLLNRVQKLIEENRLLCRGDGVIVGCSGGPDSLCLLHLLLRLREPMELRLRVVHLEHGFRGQASEQDAGSWRASARNTKSTAGFTGRT